jgi:hypothetical protein
LEEIRFLQGDLSFAWLGVLATSASPLFQGQFIIVLNVPSFLSSRWLINFLRYLPFKHPQFSLTPFSDGPALTHTYKYRFQYGVIELTLCFLSQGNMHYWRSIELWNLTCEHIYLFAMWLKYAFGKSMLIFLC